MPLTEVDVARLNDDVFTSTGTNKNRIINGDMRIDQRNAGASVTPADGTYTLDRWRAGVSAASKLTIQQNAGSVTPPAGFTNYLGVTSSSAYSISSGDYFTLAQIIEGFNTADLSWGSADAQKVTLSFWIRSSLTGTFGGSLRNSSVNRSYPFTYSINTANTWEYKTITVAGDTSGTWLTNNGTGIIVTFGLGVGSTLSGTAGVWAGANYNSATGATSLVGTNGATLYVTGVQLEAGDTATPFERRNYGQELRLCQRYFQKIIWSRDDYGLAVNTVNDFRGQHFDFPVELRASPTFVVNQGWNLYQSSAVFWNNANAWIFYSNGKSWQPIKDLTGEPALTNFTTYLLRSNVGSNNGYTAVNINVSAEL